MADGAGGFVPDVERRSGTPVQAAVVGWVCLAFVGWIVAQEIYRRNHSHESQYWATTSGEVFYSKIAKGSGRRPAWWPKICFQYAALGHSYSSCRATFAGISQQSAAQRMVDRYPRGMQVRVFYRPEDPSDAVLEPGTWDDQGNLILGILSGGALLIFAAVSTLRALHTKRST
jgi:hypothetical protein